MDAAFEAGHAWGGGSPGLGQGSGSSPIITQWVPFSSMPVSFYKGGGGNGQEDPRGHCGSRPLRRMNLTSTQRMQLPQRPWGLLGTASPSSTSTEPFHCPTAPVPVTPLCVLGPGSRSMWVGGSSPGLGSSSNWPCLTPLGGGSCNTSSRVSLCTQSWLYLSSLIIIKDPLLHSQKCVSFHINVT